jgi:hypothetical protein
MSRDELHELASELDRSGVAGSELAIRRMVREARTAGVASPALDVLADLNAPDVVRLRAFGLVAGRLLRAVAPTPQRVRPVA